MSDSAAAAVAVASFQAPSHNPNPLSPSVCNAADDEGNSNIDAALQQTPVRKRGRPRLKPRDDAALQQKVIAKPSQEVTNQLSTLRAKMIRLSSHRQRIKSSCRKVDVAKRRVIELQEQRSLLRTEKRQLLDLLQTLEEDEKMIERHLTQLEENIKDESGKIKDLMDTKFESLKDEIDALRLSLGLQRLPTLQEEEDEQISRYLELRRQQWKDAPTSTDA
eukprot:TRINITY_DN5608_c0_g1_i1.p1 TRINITY_DN5608_c0_g1~~TRINITY_DN5608_c0_g1_i1.p1  ORF type:complete len:220 (+),score=58.44 TRINITY_DN5608_c0_g1_i1:158-817(+)